MTAEVINAKQGLTRIPTYAELIKEIDREKFKTNDIRKIFDRNAWYFHESPQGQALNTNNIHPADLQQMNFKKMAEEATARKEEETPNLDFEDMTDLRDDAISDFEMSFDREAELREENERRVAEQANLSHSQDHYMANKGAYDAVGATASAGIQEDEEPPSSSRSILKKFLKSSKPVIKAVATAGGTAKGGYRHCNIRSLLPCTGILWNKEWWSLPLCSGSNHPNFDKIWGAGHQEHLWLLAAFSLASLFTEKPMWDDPSWRISKARTFARALRNLSGENQVNNLARQPGFINLIR